MLQFIAEHTPRGLDDFTAAYLEAAEWLLDEETDRAALTGWAPGAVDRAKADCARFQVENAALLDAAWRLSDLDYDDVRAGHDFWLTRNLHGCGFWDRDLGEVGDQLTLAAHCFGECDAYAGDDSALYFS